MPDDVEKSLADASAFSKAISQILRATGPSAEQVAEIKQLIGKDVDAWFNQYALSESGKDKQVIYAIRANLITKASVGKSGVVVTDYSIRDIRKVVLQSTPSFGFLLPKEMQIEITASEHRSLNLEIYIRHEEQPLILSATSDSKSFKTFYRALRSSIASSRQ